MTDPRDHDEEIRAAFEALRVADEGSVPSFASVRARRLRSRGVSLLAPMAVAAALMLTLGVSYTMRQQRERLVVPREVLTLAEWRPQTDALLEMRLSATVMKTSRFDASLIDDVIKGEAR